MTRRIAAGWFFYGMILGFALSFFGLPGWAFFAILAASLVLCPAKWDPAILIKEDQIRKGYHPES